MPRRYRWCWSSPASFRPARCMHRTESIPAGCSTRRSRWTTARAAHPPDRVSAVKSDPLLHLANRTAAVESVALAEQRRQCGAVRCTAEHCLYRACGRGIWQLCRCVDPAAVRWFRQSQRHTQFLRRFGHQRHGGLQYPDCAQRADVFDSRRRHDDLTDALDPADREGAECRAAAAGSWPQRLFALCIDALV